ncbi:MAG TPA: APC family permease [Candidatus Acidoferrales bacterium]|nr:APC family permease [Candidatus Acidoferrales bacterium]
MATAASKPGATSGAARVTLLPLIAAVYLMVSGGPFGLEDIVSKAGYAGAILILLVTPLIWALPAALMVAELSSALPEEGGFYVWAFRSMGPFWGFQEAWLSLVGSIFDMAIYPTLFVGYLGHFAPSLTAGGRGIAIGVAMIAVSAAWNVAGAKTVGGSGFVMTMLLLAPFAVLAAYAGFHRETTAALPVPLHNVDILGGILVAMWNYMGWDNASTIAGEVDRPQRTYPLAMAGAVTLVTLSYVVPVGAVALTGLDANRWSTGGWADVSRAILPPGFGSQALAVAITVGGILGAVGSLNALTMSLSRLPAVMAEDGFLPKVLARRHSKTGAPWVAIVFCAAAWALCLTFSFTKLIVLDVLLTGLSILLEFASLVALRIREPELPRPYRVPGGMAGAIGLGILPLALLVLTVIRNDAEPLGPINALEFGAILVALGVVFYFFGNRFRKAGRI